MERELRFGFGKNWDDFRANALNPERIEEAQRAIAALVGAENLRGKTVLDIGCGSGLMSLAALRSGAAKVVGFDYDPDSVSCSESVRASATADEKARWTVLRGSALDPDFVKSLGEFDVVYSWGVLHHTGEMWKAIETAMIPVRPGGLFVIALYNKVRGELGTFSSESWHTIKRAYVSGGRVRRASLVGAYSVWRVGIALSQFRSPIREVREYKSSRGMSWLHDAVDWVGGFPYEYASVEEVERFVEGRGLRKVKTIPAPENGWGNNEFVFERP